MVPPRWAFPETNLRTYVAGPGGRQGLWFLRMEVTALWFVLSLRALGLAYVRQQMSVESAEGSLVYDSRPSRPSAGGGHHIVVHPMQELRPPEVGPPVEHEQWRVHAAEVAACSVDSLFRAGCP